MTSTLPVWAESAGAVAIVIIAAFTGIYNYLKTQKTDPSHPRNSLGEDSSRTIRDLLTALREFQDESNRDMKRTQRFIHELQESINRNTEALHNTNRILKH
jgi:hypothetical protein